VPTNVGGDFWSVGLIFLFMKIILVVCGFNRTIGVVYAFFVVYGILLVCE
jgi:hypothetical protein